MAADPRHLDIARIALKAAGSRYEAALAGGNALLVRRITNRPTQDIDVFVRRKDDLPAAANRIKNALRRHGYTVSEETSGWLELDGLWPELGESLLNWEVTPPDGGEPVQVQIAYFDGLELEASVVPGVGLVVTEEYAAVRKMTALLERFQRRDFWDVASLVTPRQAADGTTAGPVYELPDLVELALKDHDLTQAHIGDAMRHLDRMTDRQLEMGIPEGWTAQRIRRVFADLPRSPSHEDDPDSGGRGD